MELINHIETILKEQKHSFKPIPVDIIIKNGNVLLRSFQILELDKKHQVVKGLTFQEAYVHARESREPEYCILSLAEIKELSCWQLDIRFPKENSLSLNENNN